MAHKFCGLLRFQVDFQLMKRLVEVYPGDPELCVHLVCDLRKCWAVVLYAHIALLTSQESVVMPGFFGLGEFFVSLFVIVSFSWLVYLFLRLLGVRVCLGLLAYPVELIINIISRHRKLYVGLKQAYYFEKIEHLHHYLDLHILNHLLIIY